MSSSVRVYGDPGSLYARCGGIFGIANFVDHCMDAWMGDTLLNSNKAVATWHQLLQRCGFKFLVTQFIGNRCGGPQQYTGRPMDVSHKHLKISPAEWTQFMKVFHEVAKKIKAEATAERDLDALFDSIRDDCVWEPGQPEPKTTPPKTMNLRSLYGKLGGVYSISVFSDRLVDALLADDRVQIPVDGSRRNEATLIYFVTEVVCNITGGPEVITCAEVEETKLLLPKANWPIFIATARVAADHMPDSFVPELMEVLEENWRLLVDKSSPGTRPEAVLSDGTLVATGAAVKDIEEAGRGVKASRETIAARLAAPGKHVAARRRVFGDPRTLYGRGGGVFGLARLSSALMDTWMANKKLNDNTKVARWNDSKQSFGFKFLVTQIMGYLTGGPQRYTGRSMEFTHKHLEITSQQWDYFIQDADGVFDELIDDGRTISELRQVLQNFQSQCIVRPGETVPADPKLASTPFPGTEGSLFYKLAGVYPIAAFADALVEAVLKGDRVKINSDSLEDPAGTRHPPGLKYVVTELLCHGTGGHEVVTSRGFDDAKLGLQQKDWETFLSLARETAATIWEGADLRDSLIDAMTAVKAEFCLDMEAIDESDSSCKLWAAGFTMQDTRAALQQCNGDCAKALALLSARTPRLKSAVHALQVVMEEPERRAGEEIDTAVVAHTPSACPFSAMMSSGTAAASSVCPITNKSAPSPAQPAGSIDTSQASAVTVQDKPTTRSGSKGPSHVHPLLDDRKSHKDRQSVLEALEGRSFVSGRLLSNALQTKLDDLLEEDTGLCCPVSLMLVREPVVASDGFVYEKSSLETLLKSRATSPMTGETIEKTFSKADELKQKALEYRRTRSEQLVNFASEAAEDEPSLVPTSLNRVGEYVVVLKLDNVPELAQKTIEMWKIIKQPVPPELTGAASKRTKGVVDHNKLSQSATGRDLIPKARPSRAKRATSDIAKSSRAAVADFQKILDSAFQGDMAKTMADKLYDEFQGDPDKLPEVMGKLEQQWGFPLTMFSLLWNHLRQVVFRRRGVHIRIQHGGEEETNADADANSDPVKVTPDEWSDAFVKWLQAIKARTADSKVTRMVFVKKREGDVSRDITDVYFQGAKLGSGAYGEVFLMMHKALGAERVMKVIRKEQLSIGDENVEDEVGTLKSLDHPHIVRVFETFELPDSLNIVMDYADGGDLQGLIIDEKEKQRTLPEDFVKVAAAQMAGALVYVHERGVIHCDLKPANAMLLKRIDEPSTEMPHVLVVDFGLAEMFEEKHSAAGPVKVKGTPLYLSPEAFEGKMSQKSDMWALGIMIFELFMAERPFPDASNVFALWMKIAKTEPDLDVLPAGAADLVKSLMVKDPAKRCSAVDMLKHSWFESMPMKKTTDDTVKMAMAKQGEDIGKQSFFARTAMFCIAAEMSMKDNKEILAVFQEMDTDQSGRLNLEELSRGMKKLGMAQDPETFMRTLDIDQNGYIEYTEFVAGYISMYRKHLSEDLIRQAFEMFDLDGDGSITAAELRSMLSGDGPLVSILPDGSTVDEIMEEVGNEDGTIDFEDFTAYIRGADDDGGVMMPRRSSIVEIQEVERCVCGNLFAVDAEFCRKCGTPRPSKHQAQAKTALERLREGFKENEEVSAKTSTPPAESKKASAVEPAVPKASAELESSPSQEQVAALEDLPPLHRWLLQAFEEEGQAPIIKRFLDFPNQPVKCSCAKSSCSQCFGKLLGYRDTPDPEMAAHLPIITRHFLAGVCLARQLADMQTSGCNHTSGSSTDSSYQPSLEALRQAVAKDLKETVETAIQNRKNVTTDWEGC